MKYVFSFLLTCLAVLCATAQPNQTDAKGKKQGPWQKNYPGTNIPQYKGQFIDDLPTGLFTYYFESGQKQAEIQHGLPNNTAAVLLYYENGQVMSDGFYKSGRKDSLWYNYAMSGELMSAENYKNDVHEGKSVYYYKEGQYLENKLQVRSVQYWTNDEPNGLFEEYFYNGKLKMTGTYKNGEKIGLWSEYYNTGQLMARINYKNDLQHGWTTSYDKFGKTQSRVMYRDGYALSESELKVFLERCKAKNIDPNQ